jgi:nitrogen regulatory protein PII
MIDSIQTIYTHGKLLLSIVVRGQGEKLVAVTKGAGARGGTIVLGRGTAESLLLDFFSIGDTEKDLVFTLTADDQIASIKEALRRHGVANRHFAGIVMQIDISHILKHIPTGTMIDSESNQSARRSSMEIKADHVLITFIVNRGYADDAMAAARKAGATGGTVVNARGTGKEEDVKFFGIALVPEKELLLILVDADKADAVLKAVKEVPCLSEPGSGIAYCTAVEDFFRLGKKAG